MKRNKNKVNFTCEKTFALATVIFFIVLFAIIVPLTVLLEHIVNNEEIVPGIVISVIFYGAIIFAIIEQKLEDKQTRKSQDAIKCNLNLNEDVYVEIFRTHYKSDVSSKIDYLITKKEGCRYFVKLLPENKFNLIVKDKYNEEVYDEELDDWKYLNDFFL